MAGAEWSPRARAIRARKGRFQAILDTYTQNRINCISLFRKPRKTGRNSKIVRPRYVEETPTGFFMFTPQGSGTYVLLNL